MHTKKRFGPLIVAAAVVVGAVILRGSVWTLPTLLAVLVCPVMMFFMMRGMNHGACGHGSEPRDDAEHHGDHEKDEARR